MRGGCRARSSFGSGKILTDSVIDRLGLPGRTVVQPTFYQLKITTTQLKPALVAVSSSAFGNCCWKEAVVEKMPARTPSPPGRIMAKKPVLSASSAVCLI